MLIKEETSMCNAEDYQRAANNLKSASDRNKAMDIAKRMEGGRVPRHEVIWIKKITAPIRASHRTHR